MYFCLYRVGQYVQQLLLISQSINDGDKHMHYVNIVLGDNYVVVR